VRLGTMHRHEVNLDQLLSAVHQALENRVAWAMADAGYDDLTVAQARLLPLVDPEGSRLTQLAAAAQVTKQTAGGLVDQLERAGYVTRGPDPADGRARLICRTDRAAGAIPGIVQVINDLEESWAARIGVERMTQLREALASLGEIAGGRG
jgi:DNA-binding MarR family transcriptional regulator